MLRKALPLLCLCVVIPAEAQTIGTCPVFPANNVWNARVDTLPVHPKSAAYVNSIGPTKTGHADFGAGLYNGAPIGIPFVTVPGSQPKVGVSFQYAGESDPGPYPVPANAPIEGGSSSSGDRHVLVIDQTNCVLYELFAAYPQTDGSWTAGSGAIFDLKANNLRPATWTSADAAGLPIFPGLARYDEMASGVIKHALRFTAPQTQKAFVWPARHQASSIVDTNYPPMGARFRLKASFNIATFSPQTQVVLRALQQYGMILADNGSAWYVSGAPDDRWDNNQLHELGQLHGTDFEAVDESSLMVDPNSAAVSGGSTSANLSLSRTSLNFGFSGSLITGAQTVALAFNGASGVSWTASSNQPNITVSPASGTGTAVLQITAAPGSSGLVTISAPAVNATGQVQVNVGSATPGNPYGSFDTPANNTSGIAGAIPVTGWALDSIEVVSIGIWREPVAGEPVAANGLVFVGDGTFVEGARADVQASFPAAPLNYRAGWGYMLLTNFLPNSGGAGAPGNGTYNLHAIAVNKTDTAVDLGTRTILVDNAHASRPFGTIDTPAQGGIASGSAFVNFGWALTQGSYNIATDGSTITVLVDGVALGHPIYNQYRGDIATFFPGLANTNGAVGFFYIDTTKLANGVHTISWVVYDNQGRGDGIGSRYFTVQNTGGLNAPADGEPVDAGAMVQPAEAAGAGEQLIELDELGRLELPVGAATGHVVANGERGLLPVGSTLKNGVFYWQPGPAFVGEYPLVFERPDGTLLQLRVRIRPR